jgi:hypothetical protein
LYSPTDQVRVPVFSATGLAAGPHTLRIDVKGERNPAATDPFVVVDAFDAAVPEPAAPFNRIQETDSTITYTPVATEHALGWTHGSKFTYWTGERAMLSSSPGSRASITFSGTGIRWIGQRGRQFGIARVTLDGGTPVDIDLYGTGQDEFQVAVFTATGLAPGTHTLTIDVTGLKNLASDAAIVVVDALDIRQ